MMSRPKPISNLFSELNEQGYLASVSDMMSGLLFIFIITLMIFVINFSQERVKTYKQKRSLKQTYDELTDAKEVRKNLLKDLKRSLESEGIRVRIDLDKGLLHVPEDILFVSGRATFLEGGRAKLKTLALHLAKLLPCYSGGRDDECPGGCAPEHFKPGRLEAVLVEGHTDNVPIHSSRFSDNWALSAKRSIVTYQALMKAAPSLETLANADQIPLFGVSGYAATRPVVEHDAVQAEPLNRRIDLRFILAPPEIKPQDN